MKFKYNVGDKVKVRSDLSEALGASQAMIKRWAGKVVTISAVDVPMPILGLRLGSYEIAEDDSNGRGEYKFLWHDDMFEGLADAKPANPMPKLTTGMFGVEDDGDMFVVVNNLIVYRDGCWENVSDMEVDSDPIVALYDCQCFNDIEDGSATVIWKRETEDTEEGKEVKEVKEVKEESKPTEDELEEFIGFLDALGKLIRSKGDDSK